MYKLKKNSCFAVVICEHVADFRLELPHKENLT